MPTVETLRPLADRLVVRVKREDTTPGGIVLPTAAQEKPQQGEVVAVGPGRTLDSGARIAVDVTVGERVLFAKYAGVEVKIEGQTAENESLLLLAEKDVLGVVS